MKRSWTSLAKLGEVRWTLALSSQQACRHLYVVAADPRGAGLYAFDGVYTFAMFGGEWRIAGNCHNQIPALAARLEAAGYTLSGLLTASLQVNYLERADVDKRLSFETEFVKLGKTLSFADLVVRGAGKPAAKASSSFAISR